VWNFRVIYTAQAFTGRVLWSAARTVVYQLIIDITCTNSTFVYSWIVERLRHLSSLLDTLYNCDNQLHILSFKFTGVHVLFLFAVNGGMHK